MLFLSPPLGNVALSRLARLSISGKLEEMPLDYFQYQVNRRWYRILWAIMLGFNLLILIAFCIDRFVPSLASLVEPYHISNMSLVFAGITLAYLCGLYWWLIRYSLPFATLIGSMFFFVGLLHGLSQTEATVGSWPFVALWLITTFLTGIYGLPLLAGSVFMTYVYISLQSNFTFMELGTSELILMGGVIVVALTSYWFWKDRFQSLEQQKVSQLSGQLRSNQQLSEILIQSIADGIIMINPEGKITLINPAAATMTDWKINEALGVDAQLVAKLSQEDGSELPAEENPFMRVLGDNQHINQTLELVGRSGKKLTISLVISPIIGAGQNTPLGAVAVIRDISEQRATEKQRAEFISTASHEMRTPVAAIEGYLALALNEKVSTVDTRARSYLEKAHSSTQHLGKLFQDLLTSSKAEDGRLTNHPAVVEMGVFMQQLSDDLKFAAEKKGLLAEFVIGGADSTIDATTKDASSQHLLKPLYYVNVDPDRMREVITNLFDNACKYTDAGKISLGLTGDNEVVQIYVRDTGAGIPADDLPHLFQKFYRVDNSATRTIGGTGLGLFICRKIVEIYHGRIWVESQVGRGSTFFINLPRLTTQRATEIQASEANKSTQTSGATPTQK